MKVKLYVTKGCFGCSVMNRNLIEVIRRDKLNIKPEIIDIATVSKEEKANFTDFPTLYVKYDNGTITTIVGSTTIDAIAKVLKDNSD